MEMPKTISAIATLIHQDWSKQGKGVNYAAKPYLEAMLDLNTINDKYGFDSGASVVAYFLGNATSWKGETAKSVKKHLNSLLKEYYKR
jgi:hypothetical protein